MARRDKQAKRFAENLVNRYIWYRISNAKKSRELSISDTTLRDGEQTPGINLLPDEKVKIAGILADLGVDSIDAGFAAVGDVEVESLRKISSYFGKSKDMPCITSLSRAIEYDIDKAHEGLCALTPVEKRGVSIFIGTSPTHREFKFNNSSKEAIVCKTTSAIRYAREKGFAIVSFSPEDASRTEPEFLTEIYEAAIDAGAVNIGFTDTVGKMIPLESFFKIKYIVENVRNINKATLAVHFHNDLGLATANSLAAIETGHVDIFQGTVGGIGERAGNTPLEEIVMALKLNPHIYQMSTRIDSKKLGPAADMIYTTLGKPIPESKGIIGKNVFRTEAGIHQAALLKGPETYEIFPPEEVGRKERVLHIGKHSGKHAVYDFLKTHGYNGSETGMQEVFFRFKSLASRQKNVGESDILKIAKLQ